MFTIRVTPNRDKQFDVSVTKHGQGPVTYKTGHQLGEQDIGWTLHRIGDKIERTITEIGFDTIFKEQDSNVGGPDVSSSAGVQERATG